jgi:beta-ureidopropionase / N-carbamoyl-L-amino-acid hydrolase
MLDKIPASPDAVVIDSERLAAMLQAVSVFGGGKDGSMTRLALSREDGAARDWLSAWFADNGF